MKVFYITTLSIILNLTLVGQNDSLKIDKKYADNWLQIDLGYDQFQYGFFTLGLDYHFFPAQSGYAWHSHSIHYGYSPWSDLHSIFYNGDFTLNGVSVGSKIIAYTDYGNTNVVFRPFVGFNVFDQIKLNFGYNIFSNDFHKKDLNQWVFSTSIGLKVTNRKKQTGKLFKRYKKNEPEPDPNIKHY
ncbi:MAG: hypothetical protein KDC83_14915 [Flavobacteriales bacterium]|nr:hypothetical protein [Flavobacteriales bacterium]